MEAKVIKGRNGKRLLSFFLALIMVMALLPLSNMTVYAATTTSVAKIGDREYDSIDEAISDVTSGQTIQLISDIDLTQAIVVYRDKNFTLDLNGHVLNAGGIAAPTATGQIACVIYTTGTLTIKDSDPTAAHTQTGLTEIKGGVLTGGKGIYYDGDTYGGAIVYGGNLTITGCTIYGNTADCGGGISAFSDCESSLTLTGTTISGNSATCEGGGIHCCTDDKVTVTIDGCTITGNTSSYEYPAGGVYMYKQNNYNTLTIKGKTVIKDNTTNYNNNTIKANLCLGGPTTTQQATLDLAAGSEIGISTMVSDVTGAYRFTTNGTDDDVKYFFADDPDQYAIEYNTEGYLQTKQLKDTLKIMKYDDAKEQVTDEEFGTRTYDFGVYDGKEHETDTFTIVKDGEPQSAEFWYSYDGGESWKYYSSKYENTYWPISNAYEGTITVKAEASGYKTAYAYLKIKYDPADITTAGRFTFGEIADQKYTGSKITPDVTIYDSVTGKELVKDTDYTVKYSNNKNAGTAKATITGIGNYTGTKTETFTITKASQKIKVSVSSVTVKAAKLAKTAKTFKPISVKNAKGTVTYKLYKASKGAKKYLKFDAATGKVTVKKGTPKGTYRIWVKVYSSATKNYKAKTGKAIVKIVVK